MQNKDIIKELKKLRAIKTSDGFILKNRIDLYLHIKNDLNEIKEVSENKKSASNIFYASSKRIFYSHILKPAGSLILIIAVVIGSGVGMSYASYDSMPGDIFYPVKITLEKAQMSMQTKEVDKVKLEVEFAGRRLEELNKVKAKEAVDKVKQPENTKIALDNYKKSIETVQMRLEKIKESEFSKEAGDVVNMVEQKSLEYSATLKTINNIQEDSASQETKITQEDDIENIAKEGENINNHDKNGTKEENKYNNNETAKDLLAVDKKDNNAAMDQGIKEAMNASEALNIKAVDIIIEKHKTGEGGMSKEDIMQKVKDKAAGIMEKIKCLVEKIALIKQNKEESADTSENKITLENNSTSTSEIVQGKIDIEKMNDDLEKASSTLAEIMPLLANDGEMDAVFSRVKEVGQLIKIYEETIEAALKSQEQNESGQRNVDKKDSENEEKMNEQQDASKDDQKSDTESSTQGNDKNVSTSTSPDIK